MKILPIIILMMSPLMSFATGQQLDVLKYDGTDYKISIFPLEESPIRKTKPLTIPIPDDYKAAIRFTQNTNSTKGITISTGNYRGYVAIWEIEDKKLYLTGIHGWIAERNVIGQIRVNLGEEPAMFKNDIAYTYQKASLKLLFPSKIKNGRVHADWFSGELFTGGRHPGIKRSSEMLDYQKEQAKLVFNIENGCIKSTTDNRTPNN
jgi:hypothetical protein